jgi:hypothetical protein
MYVCMYVWQAFVRKNQPLKWLIFIFPFLLTYNSIAPFILCINHLHTSTYLTITYYFTYLHTYLPTKLLSYKSLQWIKAHLGETLDYCSYNNSMSKVWRHQLILCNKWAFSIVCIHPKLAPPTTIPTLLWLSIMIRLPTLEACMH